MANRIELHNVLLLELKIKIEAYKTLFGVPHPLVHICGTFKDKDEKLVLLKNPMRLFLPLTSRFLEIYAPDCKEDNLRLAPVYDIIKTVVIEQ